ncbi:hypothetical protein ACIQKB_37610 [Streptomyces sp. NPDC092046]|uniref:hypothetical protein n=1 Tax=Streptomyces sp. NPDC092046 TaxID=3366009 RepID=UPI00380832AD
MTDDLPADRPPGPASDPHDRDDLGTLTAARQLVADDHLFTASGLPGTFRLQLFTAPGVRPVAVATQMGDEEGMVLMNGAESYVGAVWRRHCPDEVLPPVWVERQLMPEEDGPASHFRRVAFASADRYRPSGPRWTAITHEQLQDLVGAPVATDRGTGSMPRPAERVPQLAFEEYAVARLARPRPFRERECMPAGVAWWRRWLRQLLPRRAVRVCCWYHGGDWHRVNTMALQVLRETRAQSIHGRDVKTFAVEYAATAGATDWETEALASLFSISAAIQPGRRGYINGQHRSQAMLEAGVRRTVVLR